MKRVLPFLIVITLTAIGTALILSALSGDELEGGEGVVRKKLMSKVLGEERELIIHLPRGYDSTKTYPVMYVLDGGSQDFHIAEKFNVLTTAGYSSETIIVGIPNMTSNNREKNLTPPFMRRNNDDPKSLPGEGDKFLDFVETELIPFVTKNYRASSTRAISGNSRGGLLAMYSLLYRPELFDGRLCFSTPFWRQDSILISKVRDFLHTRDTLKTFIYMSAGDDETTNIKSGLTQMAKTLKHNAPVGLQFHSEFTPDAVHQNNAIISATSGIARWNKYLIEEGDNDGEQ